MPIVGGMDIHRKQITFDDVDLATGEVVCGQIAPADRRHLRAWLERFEGIPDVAFAFEACTGWQYPGPACPDRGSSLQPGYAHLGTCCPALPSAGSVPLDDQA